MPRTVSSAENAQDTGDHEVQESSRDERKKHQGLKIEYFEDCHFSISMTSLEARLRNYVEITIKKWLL